MCLKNIDIDKKISHSALADVWWSVARALVFPAGVTAIYSVPRVSWLAASQWRCYRRLAHCDSLAHLVDTDWHRAHTTRLLILLNSALLIFIFLLKAFHQTKIISTIFCVQAIITSHPTSVLNSLWYYSKKKMFSFLKSINRETISIIQITTHNTVYIYRHLHRYLL